MNFLLLGNGGREHALAWKLQQSALCDRLYTAPGNAGTALCGENIPVSVTDFEQIKKICLEKEIDLVLPGPELPLVEGISDFFKEDPEINHISVLGPGKSGARLEGSKAFAKAFMGRHQIPTAAYREFDAAQSEEGERYLYELDTPIVLKADGLAGGKGVIICDTVEDAVYEFNQMIHSGKFGRAGHKVVVEQFIYGIELSVFVLTDGKNYLILPEAKDYKRIGEKDTGLNTGGMGAVSPVPFADAPFMKRIEERIIKPTINGIRKENLDYCGFLFLGLIKEGDDPYVIEYNCRLGDPETEVLMPLIKNDLGQLLKATAEKTLSEHAIEKEDKCGATTVVVSGGYPEEYQKGLEISLPETSENENLFYGGAVRDGERIVTSGGRVIAATAQANTLKEAIKHSAELAEKIQFKNKYYRKDIGWEF